MLDWGKFRREVELHKAQGNRRLPCQQVLEWISFIDSDADRRPDILVKDLDYAEIILFDKGYRPENSGCYRLSA